MKNKFRSSLEAVQIKNKINYLSKNKIDVDSLKKDPKEFIKNNKLILKTQQRLRIEKHKAFTEKNNKIKEENKLKL